MFITLAAVVVLIITLWWLVHTRGHPLGSPKYHQWTASAQDGGLDSYANEDVYRHFAGRLELQDGPTDVVDMLYCITMPSRREYAIEQANKLGMRMKIMDAITPDDLTMRDYQSMSATFNPLNHMYRKITKLPVALSFFTCYYDAYVNKYNTIMVIEDDIRYVASVEEIHDTISKFKGWPLSLMYVGACYYGPHNIKRGSTKMDDNLYIAANDGMILCNHALVMKQSFIKDFMERQTSVYYSTMNDHTLDNYRRENRIPTVIPKNSYIIQNREDMGSNNENIISKFLSWSVPELFISN